MNARIVLLFGVIACQYVGADTPRPATDSALIQLIDEVEVPARVAGVLSQVHVEEGQYIDEGALLVEIDDVESRLARERTQAELEIAKHEANNDVAIRYAEKTLLFARSNANRVKRAARESPGSVSRSQLEEAELQRIQTSLDLERAKSDLKLAKLKVRLKESEMKLSDRGVEQRTIRSPLSGVVVEVARKRGEFVEPGEHVLRIVRVDRLRVQGYAPINNVMHLSKGSQITVSVDLPDKTSVVHPAKIVFISPEINPVNGYVQVWADIDNPKRQLRPGLRAQLLFDGQRRRLGANGALGTAK